MLLFLLSVFWGRCMVMFQLLCFYDRVWLSLAVCKESLYMELPVLEAGMLLALKSPCSRRHARSNLKEHGATHDSCKVFPPSCMR